MLKQDEIAALMRGIAPVLQEHFDGLAGRITAIDGRVERGLEAVSSTVNELQAKTLHQASAVDALAETVRQVEMTKESLTPDGEVVVTKFTEMLVRELEMEPACG